MKQLKQVDDEFMQVLHSPVHDTQTPFNASMNNPSPQSVTQELSNVYKYVDETHVVQRVVSF